MTPSLKPTDQDLPQLVAAAVDRARAARQTLTELSPDEAAQVGGAATFGSPVLTQPAMPTRPGDWAGPYLAPATQQIVNPGVDINVGSMRFR